MKPKRITPVLLAALLTVCSLNYGRTVYASEIDSTPPPVPEIASEADNALYWIDPRRNVPFRRSFTILRHRRRLWTR